MLANKSTKFPKTVAANDKGEGLKCQCNIISFILLKCVLYATAKEDIKPMVLLKVPKK